MRDANINRKAYRIDYDDDMPRSASSTWALVLLVATFWVMVALGIRWLMVGA